ncbi:hypothetical protein F9C07_1333685 [Aspergillus flavus]|uniref:Uncharacterized protein n=1 Tax=Aspergillus flavus (strain ATCC 200026 / FGSC A1120 / IAM 13836 / NRRL 3357 / JCM 12722 / SRRC 167) TaxID=332952 RepID=A0A7U2QSC2_ASPFN|nr:hypothetical protein F9C07_1333685 [Aspergillus flavus]
MVISLSLFSSSFFSLFSWDASLAFCLLLTSICVFGGRILFQQRRALYDIELEALISIPTVSMLSSPSSILLDCTYKNLSILLFG